MGPSFSGQTVQYLAGVTGGFGAPLIREFAPSGICFVPPKFSPEIAQAAAPAAGAWAVPASGTAGPAPPGRPRWPGRADLPSEQAIE